MGRLFAWIAGLIGLATIVQLVLRYRRDQAGTESTDLSEETSPTRASTAGDDPADELRRKLDERRGTADEVGETEAAAPDAQPLSVDERRAAVHARAREAIDALTPESDK